MPASTALSHLTVLDLTRVRAGPTAVRQLADWGAKVVKIEMPLAMDEGEGVGGPREGSDFRNVHRNKRGMTLNLKSAEGVAILKKLVTVVLDSGDAWLWGGEALVVDGAAVGEVSSAGWSDAAGRCVGLGYLRGDAAARAHAGSTIAVDLWGEAVAASAWDAWNPAASAAPSPR